MIGKIADKLGVDEFQDEELYPDEEEDDDDEDFDDDDDDFEDDEDEDDFEGDDDEEDDDEEIFESRSYKKMRLAEAGQKPIRSLKRLPKGNMNPLDDFGKHPAYQKTVMSLPPKDHKEFPGYYDMNDDSVKNDQPYGNNIGDGAPFEVDIEEIQNTIAESIKRHLGIKGRAAKKKR